MQTFLPYTDILQSLSCLDSKRLGKQRVEALQIMRAIRRENYGWKNHPAVKMWKKNYELLKVYYNTAVDVWKARGYKNTLPTIPVDIDKIEFPLWWGGRIHATHRSNLLRKNPVHYKRFNWREPNNLPYHWPS